jgi:hypothetical protein
VQSWVWGDALHVLEREKWGAFARDEGDNGETMTGCGVVATMIAGLRSDRTRQSADLVHTVHTRIAAAAACKTCAALAHISVQKETSQ